MLPDDVVQKIRAKETHAEQAKVERAEKKEHASELSDAIRLEQLRRTPKKERCVEEEREFRKLYGRQRRRDERREQSPFAKIESVEQFWEANRLTLPKKKLDELLALQKLVDAQSAWMLEGWRLTPSDPGYVEFEEGYARLKAFVKEHGLIKDVSEAFDNEALRDISYFALWCPIDSQCGETTIPAFFQSAHFDSLCKENRQTEVYAKYGIRVAPRWSQVAEFKRLVDSHNTPLEGLHYRGAPGAKPTGQFRAVNGCWLCKQEGARPKP